jgi:hypothetical protein
VIAAPEMMAAAATDVATIGSNLSAAHTAAAPTLAVIPATAHSRRRLDRRFVGVWLR